MREAPLEAVGSNITGFAFFSMAREQNKRFPEENDFCTIGIDLF